MKLYLIGIGGTGARVIKSLMMLLASGVDIKAKTLVPIIIDPHKGNEDRIRTNRILENYKEVRGLLNKPGSGFFKTEVVELADLDGMEGGIDSGFYYDFFEGDNNNQDFKTFLDLEGLNSVSPSLRDLMLTLFDMESMSNPLTVGFKGNPNLGSIVLNQLADFPLLKSIGRSFSRGDRIFIVSSIFGGTGAAGFPVLLRNLRQENASFDESKLIASSPIGALTVMPYFSLSDNDKSDIDSNSFVTKTVTALKYYKKYLSTDLDALYYIGDGIDTMTIPTDERGQRNPAHFVELIGALSIVNFCNRADKEEQGNLFHEYAFNAFREELSVLTFKHIPDITKKLIGPPLVKFAFLRAFLTGYLTSNRAKSKAWFSLFQSSTSNELIDKAMPLNIALGSFLKIFEEWMSELRDEERETRTKYFGPIDHKAGWSQIVVDKVYSLSKDDWDAALNKETLHLKKSSDRSLLTFLSHLETVIGKIYDSHVKDLNVAEKA